MERKADWNAETGRSIRLSVFAVVAVSACFALLLAGKSAMEFSRSGPQIADEITRSYLGYAAYALARLSAWAFVIAALMAAAGVFAYHCLAAAYGWRYRWFLALGSAALAITLITFARFAHLLLYMPGGVVASFNYGTNRLYPLWEVLSPTRVAALEWAVALLFIVPIMLALLALLRRGEWRRSALIVGIVGSPALLLGWSAVEEPPLRDLAAEGGGRPNILMIGSDTLRADRLGVNGNTRRLTPNIDALAAQGTNFSQYIVPIGRTAPSLLSLLTGTWPHTHGVRDNYVGNGELVLPHPALPEILRDSGYRTAVVGDWAASDLGKFELGFDHVDTSPDQWNLKYLLRQGPKDIRLFLSLFTHNRFGKRFLPEVYYLAGMPLTAEVGRDARQAIRSLARQGGPFFLNVFVASTHGPFSAPYPYYRLFADPAYRGDSLFSMSRVSSVEEVLKAQEEGRQHFDVRQIFDLYDGAVKSFDDEVGRILAFLRQTGLDRNTIVVIYSDHGVDLFEGETWGQGNIVSDFSYRAPLVVYDPRRTAVGNVHRTVRAVDVAPTILDLAEVSVPPFIEGRSLRPFLEHGDAEPDRVAFAETGIWIAKVRGLPRDRIAYPSVLDLLEVSDKETGDLSIKPAYKKTIVSAKSRLAREGRWALVYFPLKNGERYALYDLQTDLAMRHDVAAGHPEIAARLKARLREWMAQGRG